MPVAVQQRLQHRVLFFLKKGNPQFDLTDALHLKRITNFTLHIVIIHVALSSIINRVDEIQNLIMSVKFSFPT